MKAIEIEVKFYIKNKDRIRDLIISLCGKSQEAGFETNICFDDSSMSLSAAKKLLRLRQDSKCRMTLKSPPDNKDEEFKIFREMEVEVSSFQTMLEILKHIGFHPSRIYEKYRETYIYEDTLLCLDTLPFGSFLEIEGDKESIPRVVLALGFDWNKKITASYLEIFGNIKTAMSLQFEDLTFENFKNLPDQAAVSRVLKDSFYYKSGK